MDSALSFVVTENLYVFLLIFVRFGAALMIMPGFGDFFTPKKVRMMLVLVLSFLLTGVFYQQFPSFPNNPITLALVLSYEFVIGILIGMMARILFSALDVAGMIIGIQVGLANAQIFNPGAQTQGSIVGTFLYLLGVALLFATNLHHVMLYAIYESYSMLPPMNAPDTASMSELVVKAISHTFFVGFKIAIPFIIIGLIVYAAMGIMGRLMPQVQIFILALPMQIYIGFLTLSFILSAAMIYWIRTVEEGMTFFLSFQ